MKFLVLITLSVGFLFGSVDINNADEKELMSLKGIGAKKAKAILEYRSKNCFLNIEEITKVNGIGQKFVELNRGNLNAGSCK